MLGCCDSQNDIGRFQFREHGKSLHGKSIHIELKHIVYRRYISPSIQYCSEACCPKEKDGNIAKDREIHNESNVWSAAQG